jgi:integrase
MKSEQSSPPPPATRDHLIYSLALGTGLRLAELVDLNVGDVYAPDGTPRSRVRIRAGNRK